MAEVFPELLGPMKTTGLPSSISTSPKRLKFWMTSLVSISCYRRWNDIPSLMNASNDTAICAHCHTA